MLGQRFSKEVIEEARNCIKNGKEIPDEIYERALGRKPGKCDSPDYDSLIEELKKCNEYRSKRDTFLEVVLSSE